jgi:hypothetical protein
MKHEHQQLGSLDKKQFSHLVTTLQQSGDLLIITQFPLKIGWKGKFSV